MIGRNWITMDATQEDELYLNEFIEMALPDEARRDTADDESDSYLSYFIEHATTHAEDNYPPRGEAETVDAEILKSCFISGFSAYDSTSDVDIIRLTAARIPVSGMYVNMKNTALIMYTLGGEGDLVINGKVRHCKKYDCVCVDCTKKPYFRAYPGQPWECAFVRVKGQLSAELLPGLTAHLRDNTYTFLTFGAGTRFRSIIWELLSTRTENSIHRESLYNHFLLGLFLELDVAVTLASEKPAIIPDIILAIQTYLDNNYSNEEITLDMLARRFGISKFHMSREFKRCVGKSPIQYLIDVRIYRAKMLLYDSNRSISDICALVGIPNANHFLYLFKEREGITPTAFRRYKL